MPLFANKKDKPKFKLSFGKNITKMSHGLLDENQPVQYYVPV
jgi:hypothetical protein